MSAYDSTATASTVNVPVVQQQQQNVLYQQNYNQNPKQQQGTNEKGYAFEEGKMPIISPARRNLLDQVRKGYKLRKVPKNEINDRSSLSVKLLKLGNHRFLKGGVAGQQQHLHTHPGMMQQQQPVVGVQQVQVPVIIPATIQPQPSVPLGGDILPTDVRQNYGSTNHAMTDRLNNNLGPSNQLATGQMPGTFQRSALPQQQNLVGQQQQAPLVQQQQPLLGAAKPAGSSYAPMNNNLNNNNNNLNNNPYGQQFGANQLPIVTPARRALLDQIAKGYKLNKVPQDQLYDRSRPNLALYKLGNQKFFGKQNAKAATLVPVTDQNYKTSYNKPLMSDIQKGQSLNKVPQNKIRDQSNPRWFDYNSNNNNNNTAANKKGVTTNNIASKTPARAIPAGLQSHTELNSAFPVQSARLADIQNPNEPAFYGNTVGEKVKNAGKQFSEWIKEEAREIGDAFKGNKATTHRTGVVNNQPAALNNQTGVVSNTGLGTSNVATQPAIVTNKGTTSSVYTAPTTSSTTTSYDKNIQ